MGKCHIQKGEIVGGQYHSLSKLQKWENGWG